MARALVVFPAERQVAEAGRVNRPFEPNGSRPVLVVGAVNLDTVLSVPHLPVEGETILATKSRRVGGGKGANQALAVAGLGQPVRLWAAVGADEAAGLALDGLAARGVDLSLVQRHPGVSTGSATVCVAADGANLVVVDLGANGRLSAPPEAVVAGAGAVLVSLEAPSVVCADVLRAARNRGRIGVLNASPLVAGVEEVVKLAQVVVVNEGEAATLGLADPREAARSLGATMVITRGAKGAEASDGERYWRVAAPPVAVRDTVGAGDAFLGALTAGLCGGIELPVALRWAVAAGSLAVTQPGARSRLARDQVVALAGQLPATGGGLATGGRRERGKRGHGPGVGCVPTE